MMVAMSTTPPEGLPIYRVLTGPDDETFCRRISDAITLGYMLYGDPAITVHGGKIIVAQALLWPTSDSPQGGH